ncbi:anthranilate synthase component I family protein [Chitinophaga nivalis]|uniref:Anthranilate synthase component I family protein n=1 Tax=Chitinophaga nivalis TaxID=2991709 RepID=A0ABT3ISY1_9BACT|nr:anthranilate synthase component I family protein [Chitinophaga nivalis]MCW3463229.1 anthranilate synthase component I family protein [Chitinophaga nivalis]MCW3487081.1 anthranilate synthase component I family protein [Chitinophaga nivalis]
MLNWGNQFNICCLLDNNNYTSPYHQHEALLAADALQTLEVSAGNAFATLQDFCNTHRDWLFGHLAYDLKNETVPGLQSDNPDGIGFPDMYFFRPRVVMQLAGQAVHIGGIGFSRHDALAVYNECLRMPVHVIPAAAPVTASMLQAHLDHNSYISAVENLRQHIVRGDCYEVNFCRENFLEEVNVYPPALFTRLNTLSPAPFAAYYRLQDKYLVCSSPERFIQKTGNTVISQPIKGTSKKDPDPATDLALQQALYHSTKERAENIMVVDLVRNDLSHTALQGSVQVKELCGIYSFEHVHHMISTITASLAPGAPLTDVIRTAFPMGSMTGAPKIRVMELIEQYEQSRRGLYSGAVGYITPEGDFDFNVVIRSVLYNAANRYLSFQTGSAITFYSDPEKEWEECLLKAAAMRAAVMS